MSNSGEIWQDGYQIDSQVDFARLTSKYVYFGPSMSTVRTTVVKTEHLIYLHNSRLLINSDLIQIKTFHKIETSRQFGNSKVR